MVNEQTQEVNEQTQEKIVDANTGLNDFIQITDKAIYLAIQNWRTVVETIGQPPKDFVKFKADVWKFGDKKEALTVLTDKPKVFSTTHVDFRKKINVLLSIYKPSELVLIRAKVVDATKKPVVYDVELA